MKILLNYFLQILLPAIAAIPVFCLVRWIVWKKRKRTYLFNRCHEAVFLLWVMFLCALASVTIIPKLEWTSDGLRIDDWGNGTINVIPFVVFYDIWMEYFERNNISYFFINFVGNIILFLPIGFCLPLLWEKMPMKKVLLIGFSCSLLIELCQMPVARGTDIDDLWLNTLGTAAGFGLYRLTAHRRPNFVKRFLLKKCKH